MNSNTATVTVSSSCAAPQITTQPTGSTITFGSSAQLSVVATGTSLTYQWYTEPEGEPEQSGLQRQPGVDQREPAGDDVLGAVTNSCGTADSNTATVTVSCLAPTVSVTPTSHTITQGSSTIFSVIASGGPNMTFQWYQGIAPDTSNALSGPTGISLTIGPVDLDLLLGPGVGDGLRNRGQQHGQRHGEPEQRLRAGDDRDAYGHAERRQLHVGTDRIVDPPGPVTITWFQQTSSGQTAIGTGTSISVSPTVTTTYLAQRRTRATLRTARP